jgi:hypothetical protein
MDYEENEKDVDGGDVDLSTAFEDESLFDDPEDDAVVHAGLKGDDEEGAIPEEFLIDM